MNSTFHKSEWLTWLQLHNLSNHTKIEKKKKAIQKKKKKSYEDFSISIELKFSWI